MSDSSAKPKQQRAKQIRLIDLQKSIARDVFDTTLLHSALKGYSRSEMKIHSLLKSGAIVQVKKGLYVFGEDYRRSPLCLEALANVLYGPSALSLEWALSYYGLIPERVTRMTSITPNRDKEFATPFGDFSYRRLASSKYSEGIHQVWIDQTNPVLMATPEKALCDTIILSYKTNFQNPQEAWTFLTENLRIDPAGLRTLDLAQLRRLVHTYKKRTLESVLLALETS